VTQKERIILAVDDEEMVLSIIKGQLELSGFRVITATSWAQALDTISTTPISAVLLDLHMPGQDGFEALRDLKKLKPVLPVIMVSGSRREDEARRAIELGAWDYVTKPIDFEYLRGILLFNAQ
jgi:DNA-binding response OmpR family regulator